MSPAASLQGGRREPFMVGHVPGVPGVVACDFSPWSGLAFVVEGQRIKPRGLRRRVILPGIPVNVEGRLNGALPGSERLLVAGREYPTAPSAPLSLRILAELPLVAVLLTWSVFGLPVGVVALNANIAVIRSNRPTRMKVFLIAAITVAAFAANLALAAVFGSPVIGWKR